MGQHQPPSSQTTQTSHLFFIGRNSRGNWVVQDQRRTCGGLFVDRTEAVRYALFENGHRPHAVIMVSNTMELDLGSSEGKPPLASGVHPSV